MVSKVERGIFTPIPITQSTKGSEKLSAAKALPKNPDNVIATWIVARNRAGSCVNRTNLFARPLPCSAIRSSFVSFIDKTAISALAKIAFNIIKIICTTKRIKIDVLINKTFPQ